MYDLYLDGVQMPVAPSKIQIKTKNNNKEITLINDGDVNVLKQPGLKEISFDLLLPNKKYPFASYPDGYKNAKFYVDKLEQLKAGANPFQFILSRNLPRGNNLGNANITVSLEDLNITDDAKEGFDQKASITLKEYKAYGTKTLTINTQDNTATVENNRAPSENAPQTGAGASYEVKGGDSLWKSAKQKYGNGADYKKIVEANPQIKNPDKIYLQEFFFHS